MVAPVSDPRGTALGCIFLNNIHRRRKTFPTTTTLTSWRARTRICPTLLAWATPTWTQRLRPEIPEV